MDRRGSRRDVRRCWLIQGFVMLPGGPNSSRVPLPYELGCSVSLSVFRIVEVFVSGVEFGQANDQHLHLPDRSMPH